ncbi:MAG: 3-methyl-2-oxobutanoate hydroxymethyltransferase, partial [Alphaproteobacteria bacterium]|nr:3-methyl-2-oxobutanoate hydroxymethyltransferase [Alphaproteobacteria bacterium]
EKAGAFAVVAEAMEEELAEELTKTLTVPVIGIGASRECDGQVLVTEDMAGLTARTPRFVKSYGALGEMLSRAAEAYAAEVRAGRFPAAEHIYRFKKD